MIRIMRLLVGGALLVLGGCDLDPAPVDGSKITLAEFNALHPGMTQSQAALTVGSAGTVLSQSDLAGIRTEMIQWDGVGISNANAMFQNGKMISKSQLGLQ